MGNGRSQIVIGIHETGRARDDTMTVVVRIIAERHIKSIFERDQIRHGV